MDFFEWYSIKQEMKQMKGILDSLDEECPDTSPVSISSLSQTGGIKSKKELM